MFLSKLLFSPPKSPRNIYFPWQTICVHKTGAFLERNRLALRVPINLTKFEIREYLRKLYNANVIKVNTLIKIPKIKRDFSAKKPRYYRAGPMYKKAIVTLEDAVPDEVKMIGMDFELGRNPSITKKNVHYGKKIDFSYCANRKDDILTGEHKQAWRLPIPNLLADDDWEMNPELNAIYDWHRMKPDPTEPHTHGGSYTENTKPSSIPFQNYPMMDLTPWRRKIERIAGNGETEHKDVQDATPTPWNFPKSH
ncbi:ribosomal protein L23, putative [Theileria equi strain WA]|uniref:Large ribosomal subunit protein uL23m n=1 Tax=Theileria equi strain WA TaxID=1537102 RepID=L1LGQ9_THEEQ|nr:ribosomal protein L23, putative [Theileria equi strain WA]EKX74298.1 ribosomal protein L23, putative [Theileria equi strain WA]|eukprot:XP_004833750.1 ribosomal protein L23, putative [Theileria equi strain WA]